MHSKDYVLSELSRRLINRNLFKIQISNTEISEYEILTLKKTLIESKKVPEEYIDYFVIKGSLYNKAYSRNRDENIKVLLKDGSVRDIASASDISNVSSLSRTVTKNFVCFAV